MLLIQFLIMEFLDIILTTSLVFGFYKGFKNGLFVELASLVAFFVGLFIALKFSYIVADLLGESLSWSPEKVQLIAFLITLVGVIFAIHWTAKIVSEIANFAFLGWANSLLGGIFGTLKTILLIGIFLHLFEKININNLLVSKETQENSLLLAPCKKTSETLLPILGDWFTSLKDKTNSIEQEQNSSSTTNQA